MAHQQEADDRILPQVLTTSDTGTGIFRCLAVILCPIVYLATALALSFASVGGPSFCLAETQLAPIPQSGAWVTDTTGTLTKEQMVWLSTTLKNFESEKGSQVVVLVVPTVKPEDISQYSLRVAEAWKIGRDKVGDGVLLTVAKEDRKLRIEVGRGLEGAIPDALAKRIIAEQITPRFKQGEFYGGIREGLDSILKLIRGEPLPPPAISGNNGGGIALLWPLFIFSSILIGPLKKLLGPLGAASVTGLIATLISLIFISLYWAAVVGVFIGIISFFMASVTPRSGFNTFNGGWSSGTSGSSWGDSGGFSGGGGDFGGGGASGDW
jgi:uncharacterized protein